MIRYLVPTIASLALIVPAVSADDALPAEVVEAVKKASVFIRVEGTGWAATGSGFVVAGDDKSVLIATNDHVVTPDRPDRSGKLPTLTVVFGSGTKAERAYPATVVATDAERDLAVLRVTGVKDVPKPIPLADAAKPTETTPVYSFGFPFGKALAADDGNPAVTVGKASVSSLRTGPDGELVTIQIDGNLNPGNSGGPVVDAKGRLVGVAEATIRGGKGIGFIVPARELGLMLRGRVGAVHVHAEKRGNQMVARIEATLIDPTGGMRSVMARYLVVPVGGRRPGTATLDKEAGSKVVELKVDKGVAAAEVSVPSTGGELLLQVSIAPTGKPEALRVQSFPLGAEASRPPVGWKEYASTDRAFVMWVPENPTRQSERERAITVGGQQLQLATVAGVTTDGLNYEGQSVPLPEAFGRMGRAEVADLFRGAVVTELRGLVTDTKEVEVGSLKGVEYMIVAGTQVSRMRVGVGPTHVLVVQVAGTAEQIEGGDAERLLNAFRLPTPGASGRGPGAAATANAPGKEPTILGGAFDPAFTEIAPNGGMLVGFEVGTAPGFGRTMTRSIRPIYRAGDKEVFGEQRGTQLGNVTTIKAKAGYAVGAVSVMHGLGFDGISVTFMKVAGEKLDPSDSYESDYLGSDERKPLTKLGGDGTPAVGIVGKTNSRDLSGFGVLFRGQDGTTAKKR